VLAELPAAGERPRVVYRQAGDAYLLVEYGRWCWTWSCASACMR
jgi:hypothetical protein